MIGLPCLEWCRYLNKRTVWRDLLAGFTGAIIVLPQGIAFALIAGLPPEIGLYTAMIVPFIAALFQSSRHVVAGPTTAVSIVLFGILSTMAEPMTESYIQLALVLTFLVGVFQLILGLIKMGFVVNFVSMSVVVGFTAGAGLLIIAKQMRHLLDIQMPRGLSFVEIIQYIITHITETHIMPFILGMSTILFALLLKRISPKIPYLLLAMIFGALVNYFIQGETHGVKTLPSIDRIWPTFSVPDLSVQNIRLLSAGAITVGIISLIQTASVAKAIALKSHQHVLINREFVSQGIAHMVGSFFRCYVGAGSFTRSGLNYQMGAATPLSAMLASVFLLLILLLVSDAISIVPIPAMAGIIMLVGYELIDVEKIRLILRSSRKESIVLALTFFATLLFKQIDYAIYIGVIASLIFYLRRTAMPRIVILVKDEDNPEGCTSIERCAKRENPHYRIVRIDGSIYFGAVDHLTKELEKLSHDPQKHLILDCKGVNFIDITGAEFLISERDLWRSKGGDLYLCNLKKTVRQFMKKGSFVEQFGMENLFHTCREAIDYVEQKLAKT